MDITYSSATSEIYTAFYRPLKIWYRPLKYVPKSATLITTDCSRNTLLQTSTDMLQSFENLQNNYRALYRINL